MEPTINWGIYSLIPLVSALLAAFWTRSAAFSLLLGAVVGVVMLGSDPGRGLNQLFQDSLGNVEFIWVTEMVILIGIFFELLRRFNILGALSNKVPKGLKTKRSVGLATWGLGFAIIDDYFSPLITGTIMRPLSDDVKMPREKLAYLLDATTSSVCILFPFAAWAAYICGLLVTQGGPIENLGIAFTTFIYAIPYNFYPILTILFALLIALKVIPDFGPMAAAERRAEESGQVIRPGATALFSESNSFNESDQAVSLSLQLALPLSILFGVILFGILSTGSVLIVEGFMAAITSLVIVLTFRGQISNTAELVEYATAGIRTVIPALLIIALAYALNHISKQLGVAEYLIEISQGLLTPTMLVVGVFIMSAAISFSTGTSWGTYALMIPLAVPIAYSFNGNQIDPLLFQTVAAIAGGGIFGDHASPVSDTSVLSSAGAGSDHMDHVITQIPYALVVAFISIILYIVFT